MEEEYDMVTFKFQLPYLLHKDTGHVISAQNKVWMDTAGLTMWLDLVMVQWL